MTPDELLGLLGRLTDGGENEVVEFKRAGNDFDTGKIGEYFSALSNEANIRGVDAGWLVFGIDDKTRTVVGTTYRSQPERGALIRNDGSRTKPSWIRVV